MRLLYLGFLCTPALLAQNFQGQIKMKPLVPPLSQPWKVQPKSLVPSVQEFAPNASPCSIPLTQVSPRDADALKVVKPPAEGFSMRFATPPAPPCTQKPGQ